MRFIEDNPLQSQSRSVYNSIIDVPTTSMSLHERMINPAGWSPLIKKDAQLGSAYFDMNESVLKTIGDA